MPDLQVLYVGSKKGMEAQLIPAQGYQFKAISCGKLRRYFSWENFLDIFRTVAGIGQSITIIKKFKPAVIFCKGGYVSLPMAVAGGLMRKPVVIHESDLKMGLANRIAAKMATKICVSFPETAKAWHGNKKVVLTGNPVRSELREGEAEKGWKFSGLKPGKKVILIMGGSQGAQFINNLIEQNLTALLEHFQIIQICGKGKIPASYNALPPAQKAHYFACEYIGEELKDIYAITDLIISRAGANSLAEIEYLNKPALLIPLVVGSRGDQVDNAESFAKRHRAVVLMENEEHFDLLKMINQLLADHHTAAENKNQAAEKISTIIRDLVTDKHVKKT